MNISIQPPTIAVTGHIGLMYMVIEGNYELPAEADDNLWSLNRAEARSSGLRQLPQDLRQALDLMEGSELVATALGDHIFEWFLRNKRSEWELYQGRVTPFELEQYLPVW